MKKDLSREQIISTALELLRDKQEFKGVNLREIARTLGCAHTNLYNYFPSYADLLWAAHGALLDKFMAALRINLASSTTAEEKLRYFFETFLDVYLHNTGWFRLSWLERIDGERPSSDMLATTAARAELDHYVFAIWEEMTGKQASAGRVSEAVHNIHCYIIGEMSNYISGRGLIENVTDFKNQVVQQANKLLALSLKEE